MSATYTDGLLKLFQGTPQAAPSYTATSSEVPKWLQDYTVDLFSNQRAVSAVGFEPYKLDRLAKENKGTTDAYNLIGKNLGSFNQPITQALEGTQQLAGGNAGVSGGMGMLRSASGMNAMGSAQPYFNQSFAMQNAAGNTRTANELASAQNAYLRPDLAMSNLNQGRDVTGRALNFDATGAASPFLNRSANIDLTGAASPFLNRSANIDLTRAASPYLTEAAGMSGLSAANPFISAAAQSSASSVQDYMNPYNRAVTDQIARLGARNLSENLLPSVSDQFIRAGSFGGSRMGEFGSRALRDTQEAVLNRQAEALQQGYGQSLAASQADLARQAQLGSTAGSLTQGQQQVLSNVGSQFGNLSAQQQQNLANIGSQFGNLAAQQQQNLLGVGSQLGNLTQAQQNAMANIGQQFTAAGQAQQGYGINAAQAVQGAQQADLARQLAAGAQIGALGQNIGNLSLQQQQNLANIGSQYGSLGLSGGNQQLSALAQMGDLAKLRQGLTAADAASLQAMGQDREAREQRGLDIAYQDFLDQRNFPQQQINAMSSTLRGLPPAAIPTTSTQSGFTTQFTPSPLSQLASSYFAGQGLNRLP
jgi:hypothetical protein